MHEHLNTDNAVMARLIERYTGTTLPPEMLELRIDNLAFLRDSGAGASPDCRTAGDVGDTGIRPGFLKCARSATDPAAALPDTEVTVLRALARVSADTGLSLQVHTAFPMSDAQVVQWKSRSARSCVPGTRSTPTSPRSTHREPSRPNCPRRSSNGVPPAPRRVWRPDRAGTRHHHQGTRQVLRLHPVPAVPPS
jgi:hypothetical protein